MKTYVKRNVLKEAENIQAVVFENIEVRKRIRIFLDV